MFFADALTLDAPKRLKGGYVAVRAKAARTGRYEYSGSEIDPDNKHGLRDTAVVNVLRDAETVFDAKSAHSFIGKPITDDHPKEAVTADNWRDNARGTVMGAKWEEGGYLAFDLLLTDAEAIRKMDAGKRELSNGYEAELEFGDFTAPDGTVCQARQTKIFGNHVALVDRGRAGSECRISDAANCDSMPRAMLAELLDHIIGDGQTYSDEPPGDNKSPHQRRETVDKGVGQVATKTITFDGMPIEATDASEAAIRKLEGQLADSAAALKSEQDQVATLTTDKATLEGEKAALAKQLEDAKLSPAQLEKMVADRTALIGQAKAIDPKVVTDGKSESEIRAAVVQAKLGDDAVKLDDEAAVAGAFAVLAKDVKLADPLRDTIKDGIKPNKAGREAVDDARRHWLADKETAHSRSNEVEA
jgi:hypothetical protein